MSDQAKSGETQADSVLSVRNLPQHACHALLSLLQERCEAYCLLTGYEGFPEQVETDIDFMVSRLDFPRIPALINEVAQATGAELCQIVPHELTAQAYFLGRMEGAKIAFVQPDATADYRHFGRLWLTAEEILAHRRWCARGFWIPSPAYEFIYYLVKRVNKRELTAAQAARLTRLYAEDPQAAAPLLRRFWADGEASAIEAMARSGDWTALSHEMNRYRLALWDRRSESAAQRAMSWLREAWHAAGRIGRPTGFWIAFMGPDGCGKSSVIEAVSRSFAPAFRQVRRFHLRPRLLKARTPEGAAVPDPHGKPAQGWCYSLAKALYLFADYSAGFLLRLWPALARTSFIVFDRYFYDLLVDSKRIRYGGPKRLLRLIGACIPKPTLVFLLNAPPEVLWSRKQELPYAELERQQQTYLALAQTLPGGVIIDASQPLERVIAEVNGVILRQLAIRTRKRLRFAAQQSPRIPLIFEQDGAP